MEFYSGNKYIGYVYLQTQYNGPAGGHHHVERTYTTGTTHVHGGHHVRTTGATTMLNKVGEHLKG